MPGSIPTYGAPLCCSILSSRCVPPPCSMCLYGSHTCLNMDLQGARDYCVIVYVVYYCFKTRNFPIPLLWLCTIHSPFLEHAPSVPHSTSGICTWYSRFHTWNMHQLFHIPYLEHTLSVPHVEHTPGVPEGITFIRCSSHTSSKC